MTLVKIYNMSEGKLTEKSKLIVSYGSKAIGISTTSLLTYLIENTELQIGAKLIGGLIPQVLNDISDRFLSTREEIKIGMVASYSSNYLTKNLDANRAMNVNFIQTIKESPEDWNTASELYESVLLRAKNESQEKKIKHIGAIFGNSVFVEEISPEDIFHLLSAVENLTYRKLCIISMYGKIKSITPKYDLMVDSFLWYKNVDFSLSTRATLQDIFELGNQGIVDFNSLLASEHIHLNPGKFKLTKLGEKYFELMDLDSIAESELIDIINAIEYKESYGLSDQGTRNGRK